MREHDFCHLQPELLQARRRTGPRKLAVRLGRPDDDPELLEGLVLRAKRKEVLEREGARARHRPAVVPQEA